MKKQSKYSEYKGKYVLEIRANDTGEIVTQFARNRKEIEELLRQRAGDIFAWSGRSFTVTITPRKETIYI